MYWNCVFTRGLVDEVAVEENDPVAIGILWPIFNVAFCPSVARRRGFCNIFVSLSVNNMLATAVPTVSEKFFAVRLARSLSVSVAPDAVLVVTSDALSVCGHWRPILR